MATRHRNRSEKARAKPGESRLDRRADEALDRVGRADRVPGVRAAKNEADKNHQRDDMPSTGRSIHGREES